MSNYKHNFHMVDPSPWPLVASFSAFALTSGGVLYFHNFAQGGFLLSLGFILVIYSMFVWWRDVIREAQIGYHTKVVQIGLRYGMLLFIVSEVMFFLAFFWAYFHSSLAPAIEIGSIWPPKGIEVFNPWDIPLVNTLILLLSGATITWAHYAMLNKNMSEVFIALLYTIVLAFIFTGFQAYEYVKAPFSIADGIYGSTFFMATGFHGFHVIIGTTFLTVCLYRVFQYHFTAKEHFGFEAAAWYWHFVDVVWLFLFITIYWWGSITPIDNTYAIFLNL